MVKAMIDVSRTTNQMLNMIKARFDLKNKSEAIDKLAELYQHIIHESIPLPADHHKGFR